MSHWDRYDNWNYVEAPLKPVPDTVKLFYALMNNNPQSILMLGCTRELVSLNCDKIIAVDKSISRINSWFPKSSTVYGIEGNWLRLSNYIDNESKFDYVIGDGSFIFLSIPEQKRVIKECKKFLNPGGKIIIRGYETPENPISIGDIKEDIRLGKIQNFSCLKLKLMFLLSRCGIFGVPVNEIRDTFYESFDKKSLFVETGWPIPCIDVIDVYENSSDVYYLPTRKMMEEDFPGVVIVETSGYPMSEHCPIYIFK